MVGVLTFHWADDYGALLQAYALRRYIESLGERVEIIPYAPWKLTGRYWWFPLEAVLRNGEIRYCLNRFGWMVNLSMGRDFWKRRRAMADFRNNYLTAERPLRSVERLALQKYSSVFIGSDQVWNPGITIGLDDAYIGNIKGRGSCRIVSYAASFGGQSLPEADREKFTKAVGGNFAAISVRERRAVPFAEGALHRHVEDALDPVLLLSPKEWEKIGKRPCEKDYVLLYCTEFDGQMMEYARKLAGRLRKKTIQVSLPSRETPADWLEVRAGGGPAEFIGYFLNASCVITNSFHGTAFSVLLEKPFFVFRHSALNARPADLLEKLGLESRLKDGTAYLDAEEMRREIGWAEVRRRLAAERRRSEQFICDNLKKTWKS